MKKHELVMHIGFRNKSNIEIFDIVYELKTCPKSNASIKDVVKGMALILDMQFISRVMDTVLTLDGKIIPPELIISEHTIEGLSVLLEDIKC